MNPALQSLVTVAVIAAPSFLLGIAAAHIWHNRRIKNNHRNELIYGIRK